MSAPEMISLSNGRYFAHVSGLWTGKKPPFLIANVLRSTNFRGHGLLDYQHVEQLDVEERQLLSRQLKREDVVVERSGGGPKQPVGRVALFNPPDDRVYAHSNFTTALRVIDRDAFDPRYVCLYLHALYESGATASLQRATTGIRNLDWQSYLSFRVPQLPIGMQRAIADLMFRCRDLVLGEQEIIVALNKLKRAVMHVLFTRGLRGETQKDTEIGLVPESWQPRTVRDLTDIWSGGTPRKSVAEYWRGDIPWVSGKDLKAPALDDSIDHISPEGLASGSRLAPSGTVLVLVRGMGLAKDLPIAVINRPMAFNQDVKALVARSEFSGAFLRSAIYFGKERLLAKIVPSAHGTMTLNLDDVETFLVPCPADPSESDEIVAILDTLDRKIDLHRRKYAVIEDLYKALLHKLMTGEISVIDLESSAPATSPDGEAAA